MSQVDEQLERVIAKIKELKSTVTALKSERDELLTQVKKIKIENENLQKRKVEEKESIPGKEMREEIDKHIEDIDACLDLLKTL